jgi:hypothetical protein
VSVVCKVDLTSFPPSTSVDAMIDFPSQPSVSCGGFQALAVQGRIDEAQCGIVQGFVADTCGCMHPDDIPPTSSPVAGSVPTADITPTASTAGIAAPTPSGVTVMLSAIATMVLGFLVN